MMLIECAADFDTIVERLRAKGPPPHWKAGEMPEIAVPSGAISYW
jgi:hypothetical protein